MRVVSRKAGAAAFAVALAGLAAVAFISSASAAGPETTYLVLAPNGNSTAKASARVKDAGGTVVATYGQIGVLVARSSNPDFATAASGSGVDAVASTAALGTLLDDGEVLDTVDATAVEATGDPTGEPLWNLQWDMPQIDTPEAHAITTGSPRRRAELRAPHKGDRRGCLLSTPQTDEVLPRVPRRRPTAPAPRPSHHI
jgi:hypothetical protein